MPEWDRQKIVKDIHWFTFFYELPPIGKGGKNQSKYSKSPCLGILSLRLTAKIGCSGIPPVYSAFPHPADEGNDHPPEPYP